jgi:flagellar biosynthesis component FlhA
MDAVSRRLLVFWFKAYGPEYISEHLDSALVSQLALVLSISISVLVAILYRKSELRSTLFPWVFLGVSVQPIVDFLSVPSGLLGVSYGIPGLPFLIGGVLTFLVAHRARTVFIGDAVNTPAAGTNKK